MTTQDLKINTYYEFIECDEDGEKIFRVDDILEHRTIVTFLSKNFIEIRKVSWKNDNEMIAGFIELPKSLKHLWKGDILKSNPSNNSGITISYRKILAVITDGVYVVSEPTFVLDDVNRLQLADEITDAIWTSKDFENFNLTPYTVENQKEVTKEVTMEQVCEKFGENVKIKK